MTVYMLGFSSRRPRCSGTIRNFQTFRFLRLASWMAARALAACKCFANLLPTKLPFVSASLLYLLISSPLPAEHTRRWRQSSYEDFLKGSAHGVAVRSDGRLELAPKFTLLADADASYLFSVRLDPKGMLYAAGGSPAKVFRFDSNAKPSVVFDSTDLSAQAIAFDSKGTLYVGTSPDGKVYK